MAEKTLKTRIIHKHEPEANWKLATGFTPKKGEIIVYDIDENYNYERFKIGDGVTNVDALPFASIVELGKGKHAIQQKLDYINFTPANHHVQSNTEVLKDENGNVLGGAFGDYSAVFSGTAQAKGKRAVAEGSCTIALGKYSHAEGNETFAAANNSHVEGLLTSALSEGGHAEGTETVTSGVYSHAEGKSSKSSGDYSHAEGIGSETIGSGSHAEGSGTCAEGLGAHSEGIETKAIGDGSHAEGYKTKANGLYSHASGAETVAGYSVQTVVGRHNNNKSDTLFEVGNGSDQNNRSNAFEVYSDGHAEVQTIGNTDNSIVTKQYVDNKTYDWASISNTPKINSDNTTFKTNISDGYVSIYGSSSVDINSSVEAKIYANGGVNIGSMQVTIDGHKTIIKNVVDPVNEKDAVNKRYVDSILGQSLSGGLTKQLVTAINGNKVTINDVETDAVENVIYLLKDEKAIGEDVYKEYILIGDPAILTMIGDTSTPLLGSVIFNNKNNKALGINSIAAGDYSISGTKCFTITATNIDGTNHIVISLDNVDGIEVGQKCRFKTNSEYYSEVLEINGNNVTLNALNSNAYNLELYTANTAKGEYTDSKNPYLIRSADGTDTEKNSLFIIGHPEIGTDRILGTNAASFGSYNNASSLNTFVAGSENNALGGFSAVFGKTNSAAYGGIVGGRNNDARLSEYGATFGYKNIYTGQSNYAFAAGGQNELNGAYTVALGGKNKINGVGSSALGIANEINGNYSNAFGYYNKTNSNYQVAVGTYNEPIVDALFMVGNGTKDARSNAFVVQKDGDVLIPRMATIYGALNLSGPMTASDMINANKGIVSTVYSGTDNAIVLNTGANKATGKFSIAGGANTNAKGYYSTAIGYYNVADKVATFVAGSNNTSNANYQTIFGSFANNSTDSLFTVGNGSSSARSNAFDVTKDGRAYLGNADIDETNETSIATKKYVDSKFITDQGVTVKLENEFNSVDLGPIGMFLASNYHINIDSNEVNINTNPDSGSTTIKNVVEPIEDGDAVNKKYVDDSVSNSISNKIGYGTSLPTDVANGPEFFILYSE